MVPTGRHGLTADLVASRQRDRLFAATVELVAERGYRNTSIDHIVKAARVGYVAFYDLYDGKEECFLAAFDRIVDESTEAIAAAAENRKEWPDRMAAGLSRLLDLIAEDPRRARLALVEMQAAGPGSYVHYEAAVDRVAPLLREGRAYSEQAAGLSDSLEEAVLGGLIWIVHQRLVEGELKQAEPLLEEAIQITLGPYVGDREAKRLAGTTRRERARRG